MNQMLIRGKIRWNHMLRDMKEVLSNDHGIGIVEMVLILVVLVALVLLFKGKITDIVTKVFDQVTNDSDAIIG